MAKNVKRNNGRTSISLNDLALELGIDTTPTVREDVDDFCTVGILDRYVQHFVELTYPDGSTAQAYQDARQVDDRRAEGIAVRLITFNEKAGRIPVVRYEEPEKVEVKPEKKPEAKKEVLVREDIFNLVSEYATKNTDLSADEVKTALEQIAESVKSAIRFIKTREAHGRTGFLAITFAPTEKDPKGNTEFFGLYKGTRGNNWFKC